MITHDQYPKFRLSTLSITGLLSLLLLISPLSLFSQDRSPASSDFDGNGVVDIPDFLLFVDVFGSKEGEEIYDAKYDLDGNGEIGIPDFLIFVDNFGKTVNSEIEEPTAAMPSNVVVENGDSKLTVRWDAVPDEEGKPSVIGYEVGYRERDAEDSVEWAVGEPTSNRLDTSVTITDLLNGQAYLVSVRTLVDGGGSEWSSPVLGIPVIPAAGPVFIGGGGGGGGSGGGGSGGGGSGGGGSGGGGSGGGGSSEGSSSGTEGTAAVVETPPPQQQQVAPQVTISAGTTPVTEGTSATFTITASSAPSSVLTVNVNVSEDGDVISGTPSSTVTINANETTATLTVSTDNDGADESNSVVTAQVQTGTGYTVGSSSSASVTVKDDDVPLVTISAGTTPVTEGTSATFTIIASSAPTSALTVNVDVSETGDVISGTASSTVTIDANKTTATSTVATEDDQASESNSVITAEVQTGTGYTVGSTSSASVTVEDNDPEEAQALPMIQVADVQATEGVDSEMVFRVTLDRAPSGPVTVRYATADGSARAGRDYVQANSTLTFTVDETEKTVRVTLINDAVEDSEETFKLVLSDPTGAVLADAEAVGTILNTEPADDYVANTTTKGTVSVGGSQTGEIGSSSDRDWIKVTLVGGTRYVIDYEGSETGQGTLFDPYLHGVYDSNGDHIPGTTDDSGGQGFNSRLDFVPESSGTYFLGLGNTSFLTGTYRVSVTEFDDYVVEVLIPGDDYEDDMTTTGSVSVGGSAVGNFQKARGGPSGSDWIRPTTESFWSYFDHDWFRVTFDAGKTYRVHIKGSWTDHGTLRDTRIAGIYDSNGNLIEGTVDDNSGIDKEARTIFTAPTTGTHYISATRGEFPFPAQDSGTYTVEVAEVRGDDYAANTATSGSVAVDGSATGTIERLGDLDWFAVILEHYATYRFDLEGIGEDWPLLEGKFIRGIYDSNGNVFAGTYTPEWRDEVRAVFAPEQSGTYYVAVGAGETFFGTGEYRLSATKFIPEVSDWLDTQGRVGVGFSVAGAIEGAHDRDWFRVTLKAGTTYQIDLEGSPTSQGTLTDPYLHGVNDSEGNLIYYTSDNDSGVGQNSRVNFTPDTNGTYYISCGALYGRTGTYRLFVREGD